MYIIYTDGSCKGNPGPGGFGVVVLEGENSNSCKAVRAYQETVDHTTNNREELKAILWALKEYGKTDFLIPIVYSDSSYCVNSLTLWIHTWKRNGWTRSRNLPIENLDLIQEYDRLVRNGYKIDLRQCRGHVGDTWNEIADKLATGKITVNEVLKDGEEV